MSLRGAVVAQFGNPRGVLGRLAGLVMTTRRSNRIRARWTVDLLDIGTDERVVDFGCGPGLAVALAAGRAVRGYVVGIDHSDLMCRQARRRNRTAITAGRVDIVHGSVERLAAFRGQVDKLCALNVVMFLADKPAAFAAFHDALRPGGTLAVTHMPRHKGASGKDADRAAENIRAYMDAAGFVGVAAIRMAGNVAAVSVLGCRAGS